MESQRVKNMFQLLNKTAGVKAAFLLQGESNLFFSDEKYMISETPEAKIFMESIRFLKLMKKDIKQPAFKIGHWMFEKQNISLYAVKSYKLLLFHSNELQKNEFDEIIVDILLTL